MWKPPLLSLSCDNWRNEFPSRFHSLKCRQIPQMITYYSCTSQESWAFLFLQWLASVLNSSFFLFWHLTSVLPSSYVSTPFFLSIWFPVAFFHTFFNKVLHMKFHLSLYGNPIRPAERAPYGTLPGSWQDSHQQSMEYHVKYINYIVTMPGSSTWSLVQLLVFPLCNNLL